MRFKYHQPFSSLKMISNNASGQYITLSAYLNEKSLDPNLIELIKACSCACAEISIRLSTLPIRSCTEYADVGRGMNIQGEEQKAMDVISNDIFKKCVQDHVGSLASEEEDEIIQGNGNKYEIAFDPLDGSSNLDVNAATGSIFVSWAMLVLNLIYLIYTRPNFNVYTKGNQPVCINR